MHNALLPAIYFSDEPDADRHLRGLAALQEEGILEHHVLVCREKRPRVISGVRILPWPDFIDALWAGEFASR